MSRSPIPRERPRPTPRPTARAARSPPPSRVALPDFKASPHGWRLAIQDPPPLVQKYCRSATPADSTIRASSNRRYPAPPDGIEWMYAENELLFPPYVIPHLARAGGGRWRALVDRGTSLPPDPPGAPAFSLMVIRLDGCPTSHT